MNLFLRPPLKKSWIHDTPFAQAGAETPDTGAEAVKLDPGSSWEGHSGENLRDKKTLRDKE